MPKRQFFRCTLLCFFTLYASSIFSQLEEETFHYGFNAGISYSSISEVNTTLIRPIFPIDTYDTRTDKSLGFVAGASVYYKFKKSKFAIQPEIYYVNQGGGFHYEDINELQYDITFRYSYLTISPVVKFYTVHGLYASVGPQLGLILDRSNLKYVSNQPELGPDLQIQQSLREVLKGNSIVSLALGGGYDTPFGLSINARYVIGFSDALETIANGFYFIENKNPSSSVHVTIGYHIPFFN